jgi:hypothetical protein
MNCIHSRCILFNHQFVQDKTKKNKPEQRNVASLFSAATAAKKDKLDAKPKTIAHPAPAPVSESAPSKSKNVKKIQSDSEDEEDDEEMDRRLAMSTRQADAVEDFWKDDEVDAISPSKPTSVLETEDSEGAPTSQPDDTGRFTNTYLE